MFWKDRLQNQLDNIYSTTILFTRELQELTKEVRELSKKGVQVPRSPGLPPCPVCTGAVILVETDPYFQIMCRECKYRTLRYRDWTSALDEVLKGVWQRSCNQTGTTHSQPPTD